MTTPTSPVPAAMLATLRGYWSDAHPAQRLAYVTGLVLIGIGLAHGLIWLIVGGTAEGPLSWRKPTTFGSSFGLTLITLSWVSQFLALSERALRTTLRALVVSFSVEVVWVSLQHARGVASHFNDSTPLDFALFLTGGVAILVAIVVIVFYASRSFTSSTASASMTLALRAGLLILLASMGAGLWMILRGTAFDLEPATVGPAGSIKLVHAVGMHAIQVLLALAWVASFGSLAERQRRQLVALTAFGYLLPLGVTVVLALTGTAATSPGAVGAIVGTVGGLCMVAAAVGVLLSLRTGPSVSAPGPRRLA